MRLQRHFLLEASKPCVSRIVKEKRNFFLFLFVTVVCYLFIHFSWCREGRRTIEFLLNSKLWSGIFEWLLFIGLITEWLLLTISTDLERTFVSPFRPRCPLEFLAASNKRIQPPIEEVPTKINYKLNVVYIHLVDILLQYLINIRLLLNSIILSCVYKIFNITINQSSRFS